MATIGGALHIPSNLDKFHEIHVRPPSQLEPSFFESLPRIGMPTAFAGFARLTVECNAKAQKEKKSHIWKQIMCVIHDPVCSRTDKKIYMIS